MNFFTLISHVVSLQSKQPLFFSGVYKISILIVGCVTMWSRGSHQLVSELCSETRSYPSIIFVFFSVPLSFSVFVSIFLFFMSASSKQKKKGVIFHLVTISNHINILKRKERERERGISWNLKDHSIFAAETQLLVNHKQTTSELIKTSYLVYWTWDRIICQIWPYSDIVCLRF